MLCNVSIQKQFVIVYSVWMLKNNNLWVERIYTKSLVNAIVGTGKKGRDWKLSFPFPFLPISSYEIVIE